MNKYGSVYTPDNLADFATYLIISQIQKDNAVCNVVLDPACGEGSLLKSYTKKTKSNISKIGIDIDSEAISYCENNFTENYKFFNENFIIPNSLNQMKSDLYWKKKLGDVSLIISNPPWSKDRNFNPRDLSNAGFCLKRNQYDAYVLFIELSYKLLVNNGYMCFILPDSIFCTQNNYLRKFLLENMSVKVIARLGEKLFPNVNRATTIILCKKESKLENKVTCFRLETDDRKQILRGMETLENIYNNKNHQVSQNRFLRNNSFTFDIDITSSDESLMNKLKTNNFDLSEIFTFSRGIEISKTGLVTICPFCKNVQPILKKQIGNKKICSKCRNNIEVKTLKNLITSSKTNHNTEILVGEDLHRYSAQSSKFIEKNIDNIDYKNKVFSNKTLILIRKTGLGIYACVKTNCLTTQSIYVLQSKIKLKELYYYLGLINSRLIYYFYIKEFGENEWKSHPYLTKNIIYSLPIKKFVTSELTESISKKAEQLNNNYSKEIDIELENEIFKLYKINKSERQKILIELKKLPNLSAIEQMKFLEN